MIRTATLLCTITLAIATTAQNWTVGVPVDMLLYTQTFYGGCNPSADYTFTFPASPVSGVQYVVKVVAMDPPNGALDIAPGMLMGLGDELVFNAEVQRAATFGNGTTSAVLEFRAQGIPTAAGQTHPCGASLFWISNLMFCPEGLIPNVNGGCTVQSGATAISDNELPAPAIELPNALNGQRLTIGLSSGETAIASIIDASGRMAVTRSLTHSGTIQLSALPDGAYVLQLVSATGDLITRRFLLNHP